MTSVIRCLANRMPPFARLRLFFCLCKLCGNLRLCAEDFFVSSELMDRRSN
jgi:hypothetical protein